MPICWPATPTTPTARLLLRCRSVSRKASRRGVSRVGVGSADEPTAGTTGALRKGKGGSRPRPRPLALPLRPHTFPLSLDEKKTIAAWGDGGWLDMARLLGPPAHLLLSHCTPLTPIFRPAVRSTALSRRLIPSYPRYARSLSQAPSVSALPGRSPLHRYIGEDAPARRYLTSRLEGSVRPSALLALLLTQWHLQLSRIELALAGSATSKHLFGRLLWSRTEAKERSSG